MVYPEYQKWISSSDMPVILTCSSQYNVLLALNIILSCNIKNRSFLVMFSPQKRTVEYFRRISQNIVSLGIKSTVIDKKNRVYRALGFSDIENFLVKRKIFKELGINGEFLLINFSWNQQIVRYPASIYYKDCSKAIFIEEGATQYVTPDEKKIYIILKKLYGNQTAFWKDEKLLGIYVQHKEFFPDYLNDKLKSFSYDEVAKCIPEEEISTMARCFLREDQLREIEILKDKNTGIVFTQPLSEDGYISETDKIGIYKDLVNYYGKYGRVVLKVHPRDATEYDFEGVEVIRGLYPSELYKMLGIRVRFAIGLCTSAVDTIDADFKMNLNEKFLVEKTYDLIEPVKKAYKIYISKHV